MQLVSTNLAGNLHDATATINAMGLADFVLALSYSGCATIAVFRVPDDVAPKLRKHLGMLPEYVENPEPEIRWKP
jgi:hypothetical protein